MNLSDNQDVLNGLSAMMERLSQVVLAGDVTTDEANAIAAVARVSEDLPHWFPRGKWGTIQAIESKIAEPEPFPAFVAIGNDELGDRVPDDAKIQCVRCGNTHQIEYGTKDGKESRFLGFVRCGDSTYVVTIDGRLAFGTVIENAERETP